MVAELPSDETVNAKTMPSEINIYITMVYEFSL